MRADPADLRLHFLAQAVMGLALLMLAVLWLLPMPNPELLPGRAPRSVVGS